MNEREELQDKVDRAVEISLCMELIRHYNSNTESINEQFDTQMCEIYLKAMKIEHIRADFERLKKLVIKQEKGKALRIIINEIIEETKKYGVGWVKEKYNLAVINEELKV